MIVEPILVVAMLWLTVAVLFGVLPWMAKLVAIYAIHGLRDRMFKIYRSFPPVRRSVLYRDIDVILALKLHVVRDHPYRDCARLFAPPEAKHSPTWRVGRYRQEEAEIYADDRGREVLSDLMNILTMSEGFVGLRMVTGHPALLALVLVSIPILIAKFALGAAATRAKRVNDIESALNRFQDRSSATGLEAIRQLFRGPDAPAAA